MTMELDPLALTTPKRVAKPIDRTRMGLLFRLKNEVKIALDISLIVINLLNLHAIISEAQLMNQ